MILQELGKLGLTIWCDVPMMRVSAHRIGVVGETARRREMTIVRASKPGTVPAERMFLTRELAEQWAELQVWLGYAVAIEGGGR